MFYKIYKLFNFFLLFIVLIIKEQEATYNPDSPSIVRERWRKTVFLPQRSSRILDVNFSPTSSPFKNSPRSRVLQFGDQNLVEVCSTKTRKPCGPTDRISCLRWSCCWNNDDDIKCTKPRYIIAGAKQCGVSAIANFRAQGFKNVVNNPILTILSKFFQPRIVGGFTTAEGVFPWIARLIQKSNQQTFCGGSLVNKKWVVTAAHCFPTADASLYSVVLGDYIISDTTGNEQFFDITQIVYHPNYNQVTQANDIAMIKLSKDAVYTRYVSPVCLAQPEFLTDDDKVGTLAGNEALVYGWGKNGPSGTPTDTLMAVKLPILPSSVCGAFVGSTFSKSGKFCAGGIINVDSCQGDSGGPLTLVDAKDGRAYLHGIVSTALPGTTCGSGAFGLYVRVRDYYTWIKGVINS